MNWKLLDSIRKNSSPLEVDLIEHYTEGAISRRDFLKRGAILGLGLTTMAGVIAACGGDAGTTTTAGDAGTTRQLAAQARSCRHPSTRRNGGAHDGRRNIHRHSAGRRQLGTRPAQHARLGHL